MEKEINECLDAVCGNEQMRKMVRLTIASQQLAALVGRDANMPVNHAVDYAIDLADKLMAKTIL